MKTTKKDFKLFVKECQEWITVFGLKGWEFRFYHEYTQDEDFARTEFQNTARWVDIKLHTDWPVKPNEQEIKKAAFHEVLEILFADLRMIASSRSFDEQQLDSEVHKIIHTFESIFFD